MCGGWRWKLNSKDKTHFKQVETKLLKLRTQINRTELVLKKLADIHGGSYP